MYALARLIGGATPGPAGARAPAGNAVPRLVPRLEKYWYFNIMSRLQECAPSRDHRAPAVPRLVTKAGDATATPLGCNLLRRL